MFHQLVKISPVFSAAFMLILNVACAYYLDAKHYAEYIFYVNAINATSAIILMRIMDFKVGKYSRSFTVDELTSAAAICIISSNVIILSIIILYNFKIFLTLNVLAASFFLLASQNAIFQNKLIELALLRILRGVIIICGCMALIFFANTRNLDFVLILLLACSVPSIYFLFPFPLSLKFFGAFKNRRFVAKYLYRNFSYIIDMVHLPLFFFALMKSYDDPDFIGLIKIIGLMVPVVGVINQINAELLRSKSITPSMLLGFSHLILVIFVSVVLIASVFAHIGLVLVFILAITWLVVPFSGYLILDKNREFYDMLTNVFITSVILLLIYIQAPLEYLLITLISKYTISSFIGFR